MSDRIYHHKCTSCGDNTFYKADDVDWKKKHKVTKNEGLSPKSKKRLYNQTYQTKRKAKQDDERSSESEETKEDRKKRQKKHIKEYYDKKEESLKDKFLSIK